METKTILKIATVLIGLYGGLIMFSFLFVSSDNQPTGAWYNPFAATLCILSLPILIKLTFKKKDK